MRDAGSAAVPGGRVAAGAKVSRRGGPRGWGVLQPGGAAHPGFLPLPVSRARQNGGKVRHKRQALQDMARPLKQWLYKHRDNPYPTKTEKILLALGSQMTLVQVTAAEARARVDFARICTWRAFRRAGIRPPEARPGAQAPASEDAEGLARGQSCVVGSFWVSSQA